MIRFLIATCLLYVLAVPTKAYADTDDPDGLSIRFGGDVRISHYRNKPFASGTIPSIGIGIPIASRYLQFEITENIRWGFTRPYVNNFPLALPTLGFRLYPFGKILSFYGDGSWETFNFNDSNLMAEGGAALDIPLNPSDEKVTNLTLGAGYFYQRAGGWIKFVDKSDHGWWYGVKQGPLFSLYITSRTLSL
jgi:hypothetical protein